MRKPRIIPTGPVDVPVSMLPESLFPNGMYTTLGNMNSPELDALASRGQVIKEMPADWSDAKKRKMAGLAQYGGRSTAGNRRSLANLPRKIKMDNLNPIELAKAPDAPKVPEGLKIPTMIPKVPARGAIVGKYLRRIVSQEEARLYEETYAEWSAAHPEWDQPEDRDDLMTICMETVIMFRLQAVQRQTPSLDIEDKYHKSSYRKQQARENLMARRKDRMADKGGGKGSKTIPNVAQWAGEFSPEQLAAQALEARQKAEAEEEQFLASPPSNPIIATVTASEPTS